MIHWLGLIKAFWDVSYTILRNEIFAAKMPRQLLQALNSLVVWEDLLYLALTQCYHSCHPLVMLGIVIIESRTCVNGL